MKIRFLGTAAAEGFPAVFCNCEFCREAQRLRGKNIRTRSQAIINDNLLIDIPADTYSHFLQNQIEGDKIEYLLITHSHGDHFYPDEIKMRTGCFTHNMRKPMLKVYFGTGVMGKLADLGWVEEEGACSFNRIGEFETAKLGEYTVTALPAKHFIGDGALIYIIQGDKTILYAHDTGYFYEEVFDYIKNSGLVFDLVTLDCTNVDIPIDDDGTHMGLPNIRRALARLESMGAVKDFTIKVINHFSHNANPVHHVLEQKTEADGYIVAYDGMEIEI